MSRRVDGQWTKPRAVANGIQYKQKRYPCFNPVLFQSPGGPLQLFYKVGADVDVWWGMVTESMDSGESWSFPRRLPEGILGPIKNKPVMIDDSTLICPSSTENDGWRLHFEMTRDGGRTWEITRPVNRFNVIQPSILVYKNGDLQSLSRSKENRVASSWSFDHGQTWEDIELTDLPNPNSGTDAVTLRTGLQLIVYNHSVRGKGQWGGPRSPLAVAVSENGKEWRALTTLESEPGEYSYPAVIEDAKGLVHITYSYKKGDKIPRGDGGTIFEKESIAHVTLDPGKLDFKKLPKIENGIWPLK